ncbi:MAG: hypothetical protein Q7R67_02300 [bacterium]|nr:hypothetical protein [bacterium]
MSEGLNRIGRKPAGYWALAAAKVAEDIRLGIPTLPSPMEVHPAYWRDMKQFFTDVMHTFEGSRGPCQDSYRLALRALGFCLDNPLLVVEGKVVGIGTLEEADTKLAALTERFYEQQSIDPEEWKELAGFLERVKFLDETDMLVLSRDRFIPGSRSRLH